MAEDTVTLLIEGMTCDGCAQTVKRSLKREKGVQDAQIDWRSGAAEVTFDPGLTDEEQILGSRVFREHYKARPIHPGGCC